MAIPTYQQYLDALMYEVPFIPTRCADQVLLGNLGIHDDVRTIFKKMGLGALPFRAESCFQDITCEFLASLTLHINPTASSRLDIGHIEFSAHGETHEMSLHAVAVIFELQEGMETDFTNANFNNLEDVWRSIAGEDFVGGVSKASTIRHPAIRYAHKYLADTFYSRKEATTVNEREMVLLAMGIKPMLNRCVNKRMIEGDDTNVNMAAILTQQLMQLKEEAIRAGPNKLAHLNVGSFVTAIFKERGIPLPFVFEEQPKFIDEIVLSTSSFLGGLVVDKYIYRFHLEEDSDDAILLPNQFLTDMRKRANVVFIPPRKALLATERGKDRAGPSTAVADEDRLYRPLQEALRDMERSMNKIITASNVLMKNFADLREQMGCDPRKRKASRSPATSNSD